MSAADGEAISVRADLGGGAEGYLVIDTTVDNSSAGGLRVASDLGLAEVAALAREMTLKFAFIGRDAGGAKSGLRLPPETPEVEKRRWLGALGRCLGPMIRRGIYHVGTDIGCGREDLAAVYAGAGLRLGATTDTALFTAIGVADVLAACREAMGSPARPLRIAVEGLGSVATRLATRLSPAAWVITAVSTVQGAVLRESGFGAAELVAMRERFGDALVDHLAGTRAEPEAVFSVEADVLLPSARAWSLTPMRSQQLRVRAVVPIANVPYADGAVDALAARGILALPGFVANCGGVFLSSLYDTGVPMPAVEQVSAGPFRAVIRALLDATGQGGLSPVQLAETVALERLERRSARPLSGSPYRRAAHILFDEHVPRWIRGRRYLERFTRNLAELEHLIAERGRTVAPPRRTGS